MTLMRRFSAPETRIEFFGHYGEITNDESLQILPDEFARA
jgi:hypothetical protein